MNQKEISYTKKKLIRLSVYYALVLICMYYLIRHFNLDWDDLLRYTPHNKILAGLVFQLFYAVKSLTVFFPLPVLQLAVGHLFTTSWALLVNFCGIFVAVSCPYFVGYRKGEKYVKSLSSHVDVIDRIQSMQTGNAVFSTYMIRIMQLPMDLVSMFLGAEHISYWDYILGSMLGMAPMTIAVTVIGQTITDPLSREFFYAVLFLAAMIGGSFLVYHWYRKHHPQKKQSERKSI